MDLRNHLVDVVAEFLYADLFLGGNEDTGHLFLGYPAVFQFFQRPVGLCFRLQAEFVIFLILILVNLVEYDLNRLVGSVDIFQCPFYDFHLFLEIRC